jgi:hypothetical protein
MGHATIHADQEHVLAFINERIAAGDDDAGVLRAGRSCDALASLGHLITDEDLTEAVQYVQRVLVDDRPIPACGMDSVAYLRRVFATSAA